MAPATTLVLMRRASTSTPSPTSSASTKNGDDDDSQTPFLFFIALAIGLVFANIWVFLGLKYCYRARRQRQLALNGGGQFPENSGNNASSNADTLDDLAFYLNPLFASNPRRTRKDRRLIDKEDLNLRFPVMKYKVWIAEQEKHGLPTEGGISAEAAQAQATSRAASIRENVQSTRQSIDDSQRSANGISPGQSLELEDLSSRGGGTNHVDYDANKEKNKSLILDPPAGGEAGGSQSHDADAAALSIGHHGDQALTPPSAQSQPSTGESEKNQNQCDHRSETSQTDNDHGADNGTESANQETQTAAGELDVQSDGHNDEDTGDMCSICLDILDRDQDVRGLTCGHVFHDDCITRWLTTRKGSCPLCKTDFCTRARTGQRRARNETHQVERPEDAHIDDSSNRRRQTTRGNVSNTTGTGGAHRILTRVFGSVPVAFHSRSTIVPVRSPSTNQVHYAHNGHYY